ncbi:MAG TPA: DUF4350 domain-containing protein [Roseateles sp.]|nr:DUF4350 domain-containing protein [Roseateles sp.]HWT53451.1 DUF4350 domain-containing protein [Rhodocyclaceae bacterium]
MKKHLNWQTVLGLLILAALVAWASSRYEWVEESVPGSVKGEAGRDQYYATRLLVERLGYSVAVINDPTQLTQQPTSSTIVALQKFPAIITRRLEPQLLAWVRNGGHLIMSSDNMSADFKTAVGLSAVGMHAEERMPKGKLPPQIVAVEGREIEVSLPHCEVFAISQEPLWSASVNGYRPYASSCAADAGGNDAVSDDDDTEEAEATKQQPVALSSNPALAMARWQVGKGTLTALCSTMPLRNAFVGKHRNAELAARLLLDGRNGAIVFAPRPEFPSLFEWLIDNAWTVIVSALALLALALWHVMPRFGPMLPAPAPARPGLREHLRAVATFHLRKHHYAALLQAGREQCQRLLERHPDKQTLADVAAHIGMSAATLHDALHLQPQSRADYLRVSAALANAQAALQAAGSLSLSTHIRQKKS